MCQAVMPSMRGGQKSSWLVVWPSFLFAERWTVSFFSREQDMYKLILNKFRGILRTCNINTEFPVHD